MMTSMELPRQAGEGSSPPVRLVHPDSPAGKGEVRYDRIAFYGRTFGEYERFFNFSAAQWKGWKVLDCHARSSSFAAEAARMGIRAVAMDPMYDLPVAALEPVAQADREAVLRKCEARPELYNFDYVKSFDAVRELRHEAVERFLADFPAGRAQGRYVTGSLPRLPFADGTFDVVLNNHYLFLYAEQFEYGEVLAGCREMARVCKLGATGEVRIYPLLGHNTRPYRHLQRLRIDLFREAGISAEVVEIPFQYLKGSNQMLILQRR